MKEAMWGVGLIMLAIFGIFLMSLFGNITVTNQQNYTALKSTVEAAMYDSIDLGRFRSGFCVCTSKPKNEEGKWEFNSSDEYTIIKDNIYEGMCPTPNGQTCEFIEGEYIIDKNVFAESFVRRFSEGVRGNADYQLIIKDVIEYPPKVSVIINSKNTNDIDSSKYVINNSIDAILEVDGKTKIDIKDLACFSKNNIYEWGDAALYDNTWVREDSITKKSDCVAKPIYKITVHHYVINSTTKVHVDDVISKREGESYETSSYSTNYLRTAYKAKNYEWDGNVPTNASGIANGDVEVIYYYKTDGYVVTVHHYVINSTTKVHADDKIKVAMDGNRSYSTSHHTTSELYESYKNNNYEWNGNTPDNATGVADNNVTVTYYYKKKETGFLYNKTSCKWAALMNQAYYIHIVSDSERSKNCRKSTGYDYATKELAISSNSASFKKYAEQCVSGEPGSYSRNNMNAYQKYYVYIKGTYNKACSDIKVATSASGAISSCTGCSGKECVAICQ